MIHEVTGDLLLSSCDLIAHGVAPDDHFQSGLALALRERFPSLAKDFRHWCHTYSPKAGECWLWSGVGPDGKTVHVANLLTQEPAAQGRSGHPGKATTHNVNKALHELARLVQKEKFQSVALPRLATGVGGLSWNEVKPLVDRTLGTLGVPVNVYTSFVAGQKAAEKPGAAKV
ncbi:MAG: macro domain-containing protein [Planctomycetes bacterium]|nr:macro domain-containing protein [Planctomycetota bacterium]